MTTKKTVEELERENATLRGHVEAQGALIDKLLAALRAPAAPCPGPHFPPGPTVNPILPYIPPPNYPPQGPYYGPPGDFVYKTTCAQPYLGMISGNYAPGAAGCAPVFDHITFQ